MIAGKDLLFTSLRLGRNGLIRERVLLWGKVLRRAWRKVGDEAGGADGAEVQIGCSFADGLVRLRMLGQGDKGAVVSENTGLFAGDLCDGVAEVVLVVERNVRNNGKKGVDDVGGIQTAAETDLQNGDVDRFCLA